MPVTRVVQYTTKPEHAAENEDLIREVFAELAADQPEGLSYASFRLNDGVSFIHIVTLDSDANPLAASAAFAKFQAGIQERCATAPSFSDAEIIGSYPWQPR